MSGTVRVTATDKTFRQCVCCDSPSEFVLEFVAEVTPKTHSSTTIRLCMAHAGATLDMLGTAYEEVKP